MFDFCKLNIYPSDRIFHYVSYRFDLEKRESNNIIDLYFHHFISLIAVENKLLYIFVYN
jgi:hypothetical protein